MKNIKIMIVGLQIFGLIFAVRAQAGDPTVYTESQSLTPIQVGPTSATVDDLIKRVRLLEQAVYELQENNAYGYKGKHKTTAVVIEKPKPIWTCRVISRKDTFYGTGETRGLAEQNAVEKCKQPQGEDYFCKVKECSN